METYLMFYDANMFGMTPWTGERGGQRDLSVIFEEERSDSGTRGCPYTRTA